MVSNNILGIMRNIESEISGELHSKVRNRVSMNTKKMEVLINFEYTDLSIQAIYYDVLAEETFRCWFKLYKIK